MWQTLLTRLLSTAELRSSPDTPRARAIPGDQTLLSDIVTSYDSPNVEDDFAWQSAIFRVVCTFLRPIVRTQGERIHLAREYRDLLTYIQENSSAVLKISELAQVTGRSRASLSKAFHQALGVPLKAYITHQTILKARELLIGTDKNVNEVADELGYEDPYYFIRVFKKHTAMTPARYKPAIPKSRFEA